ncbi:MAG: hypothetical protein HY277_09765 [Ignavibacteriales bacterium]|nr:hypothetical protein [Ignavibacteriales bacterium]
MSLIEAQSPFAHFWNLMLHDRIFQVVMLDFTFFFVWVFFWMIDRARMNGRNPYPWLLVGMCVATLMIYLYILTERRGSTQSSSIR